MMHAFGVVCRSCLIAGKPCAACRKSPRNKPKREGGQDVNAGPIDGLADLAREIEWQETQADPFRSTRACGISGQSIAFTVPGPVVTWKRVNDYRGRKLTDKAVRVYKSVLAGRAQLYRPPRWPMDARYAFHVIVSRPNLRSDGDWDNYGKLPSDAFNRVLWNDDRQVDDARVQKVIGPAGITVRVAVMR